MMDTSDGRDTRDRPENRAVQLSPRLRLALDKNCVFKLSAKLILKSSEYSSNKSIHHLSKIEAN